MGNLVECAVAIFPMKYNYFLFSLLLCTQAYAQGMRDNACFWLFHKSTLVGEVRPERVLTTLGLIEGTDFSGRRNRSIVVVRGRQSDVSILFSKFQRRWPNVQLFYTTETGEASVIRAHMRLGVHVARVEIPLAMLANYQRLEWHISQLNENLKRVESLSQEPVDFFVRHMTSLGFELEIQGFRNRPINAQLAWMWRRQERHQFYFTFTNHFFDSNFTQYSLGVSVGKRILLADFLLLSGDKSFPAFLAHEIVHSTNETQFQTHGDATGMISFLPGESNTAGLFGETKTAEGYKRGFVTDEMEAWLMTERLSPEVRETAGVSYRDFLFNQIEWLEELKRILPGQYMNEGVHWMQLVSGSTELAYLTAFNDPSHDATSDFRFVLFKGAPHEVVVLIPRVQRKVEEMGGLAYLQEVIDQRLRQLHNRVRLSEL
jgi:hypothetical protein